MGYIVFCVIGLSDYSWFCNLVLIVFSSLSIFGVIVTLNLLYDVASGIEITPCNKIDKQLVVYRLWETL